MRLQLLVSMHSDGLRGSDTSGAAIALACLFRRCAETFPLQRPLQIVYKMTCLTMFSALSSRVYYSRGVVSKETIFYNT